MNVVFIVDECGLKYPCVSTSGSHARAVPPNSDQWQVTVNRFWRYITDLNQHTDGVVKNLKTHQISRELE